MELNQSQEAQDRQLIDQEEPQPSLEDILNAIAKESENYRANFDHILAKDSQAIEKHRAWIREKSEYLEQVKQRVLAIRKRLKQMLGATQAELRQSPVFHRLMSSNYDLTQSSD